jgi:hypothetical protein
VVVVVGVAGLGLAIIVVNAELVNHVAVPVVQVAASVEFCPAQIVAGLAKTAVGAAGVGLTVRVTFAEALLHPAALTHAT